jgi:hypothetical protein
MKRRAARPGSFLYHSGMVFEVDNCGKRRPRKDIGPGYRGKYKHKFFTPKKPCRR